MIQLCRLRGRILINTVGSISGTLLIPLEYQSDHDRDKDENVLRTEMILKSFDISLNSNETFVWKFNYIHNLRHNIKKSIFRISIKLHPSPVIDVKNVVNAWTKNKHHTIICTISSLNIVKIRQIVKREKQELETKIVQIQEQENVTRAHSKAQLESQLQFQLIEKMNRKGTHLVADHGMDEAWLKNLTVVSKHHKRGRNVVLVKWHFMTKNNVLHTILLQHLQDSLTKNTLRILWIDGREKYNDKSDVNSFRIEMDDGTLVVLLLPSFLTTDSTDYRLTINGEQFIDYKTKIRY